MVYKLLEQYQATTKHNEAWTPCIFLGMYCTLRGYDDRMVG